MFQTAQQITARQEQDPANLLQMSQRCCPLPGGKPWPHWEHHAANGTTLPLCFSARCNESCLPLRAAKRSYRRGEIHQIVIQGEHERERERRPTTALDLDDVNWWREQQPSASPHMVGKGGADPEPPHLFTPGWNQVRQLMRSLGSAATCWRQTSAGGWEKEFQRETYVGDAVPGEPTASWRRRALLRATQRGRSNRGLMTLKLSLIASIKTGDFIKRTSNAHALLMGNIPAPEVITVRVGSLFQQQTVLYSSFNSVQLREERYRAHIKLRESHEDGEEKCSEELIVPQSVFTWSIYVFPSAKTFSWFYNLFFK
ncbi:uncharacterized protein LOC110406086 [Numida meleagris]|uniref:uncharacterized protein LOC110406086 n=1 Tax=Numida meleagris TaxID=8996 RepID=UPI000B3E3800|nr:uncharacterized protein LOC110406086 [Numida meleagris]